MKSIRRELTIGLVVSGFIGTILLAMLVVHEYGFLSDTPPPTKQALIEIVDHVIIPVGLFVFMFGVGTLFVVRRVESKLSAVAQKALFAADSLNAYQAPANELPAEIRPFVEAVNLLVTRLEDHARRQETFAADAAHELKTPLAILALELDKLPAADANRMGEQMSALSGMIDQLLVLARSNSPSLKERKVSIDLSDVGRKLVAELAPSAINSGKTLSFEENSPSSFMGLEEAVVAALRTITVNALRATPEGAGVVIIAGPGPRFTVTDGGEGLACEELKKLKARGVRADHAPGGVAGLGLAIADRIVEAHGGELVTCMPEHSALCLDFSS
jgi:signal transduction histidine kinase